MAAFVRQRVWRRRGVTGSLAWVALRPLSAVFAAAVEARNLAYAAGLMRATRASLPVVSVGNLAVGGAGKTPFSLWLAEALRHRGWQPAIVLRGYGGAARQATVAAVGGRLHAPVDAVGDEAAMLGKRFAGAVVVSRVRAEGVGLAGGAGCDVAVLDDGFQHRRLARDCDVVLVGAVGGPLLPAGRLREPLRALGRADIVVQVSKGAAGGAQPLHGVRGPIFQARFVGSALVESVAGQWHERPLGLLAGRRVATVSGIADPQPFHELVRQWEARIVEIIAVEDHHRYTPDDWRRIAGRTRDADLVITTEKDLVKLELFPFARGKLLALRIAPEVDEGERLVDTVCARLQDAKEGDGDGDQSGVA